METLLQFFKNERVRNLMPATAFSGGLAWDSLTLMRIDALLDNIIIILYLILVTAAIILSELHANDALKMPLLKRFGKYYEFGTQFLFGGLFSMYVVYYFKSASIFQPTLFILILIVIMALNEFFEKKVEGIYVKIALLYFVYASFFIFFMPVIFKAIGILPFVTAISISLVAAELVVDHFQRLKLVESAKLLFRMRLIPMVLTICFLIFYMANWIPPVPLALKTAGIYNSVVGTQTENGKRYTLSYEKPGWYKPWISSNSTVHFASGDTVFCFTAVFATTDLNTDIYHQWQRYDEENEEWLQPDKIKLNIRGGRDDGYRLYSYKTAVQAGEWRVNILTETNATLGSLSFDVEQNDGAAREMSQIVK